MEMYNILDFPDSAESDHQQEMACFKKFRFSGSAKKTENVIKVHKVREMG